MTTPTWRIVFWRELRDLWIGGKALYLILIYSILLGIYSYLLASNAEVDLIPREEVVLEMVKASIAVGLFICLIIGADAVAGERERATLEGLLLTPTSRRQIVLGKVLAAVSPWPVALVIAVPYWVVLSKSDPVFWPALFWGVLLGTLLAPALVGVGMLASLWCNSNKTSMLASLTLYLLLLLPTELMSGPQKSLRTAEQWFRAEANQWVNPLAATSRYLWHILVNHEPPGKLWYWHVMPVVFTILILGALFVYAAPRLRLEADTARKFRAYRDSWRRLLHSIAPRHAPRRQANPSQDLQLPTPAPRSIPEPSRVHAARRIRGGPGSTPRSPTPAWVLVFKRELRDLWIGGRALPLTLLYTVVLGIYTYIMARDSVFSLVPPKEMVYEITKCALFASVVVGVILGADALSGERERATLEGLLLTPASRRQIVVGKFLAAISPWPVTFAVTVPYLKVLSQGDEVFGQACLWGALLGTALTPAFTALGMFVSFWCSSNKTSLFVSLCIYLLFLLPTQLPGHAQSGPMGLGVQWVNPLGAPRVFLASMLVNNWTMAKAWSWTLSPFVFAAVNLWLLFGYAGPALGLEGGKRRLRVVTGITTIVACLFVLSPASAMARPSQAPPEQSLQVSIDVVARIVRAGTPIEYSTVVTNTGTESTPPLIMAMNIINLNKHGEVVDPEDWSPERTQYLDPVPAGQTAKRSWRINAILDGDYMVYMVAIPAPRSAEATTHPAASPGFHLNVTKYTRLNPGGVIPYAIGGPLLLGILIYLVYRHRHAQIDAGGGE